MRDRLPAGIYGLTPSLTQNWSAVVRATEVFLGAGMSCLQYRRNQPKSKELQALVKMCEPYKTALIVNNRPDLAAKFGLGVHLGQSDDRRSDHLLLPQAVLGITCHSNLELVGKACERGASYVSCGALFASATKPQAARATLADLQAMVRYCSASGEADVVAVGGIQSNHCTQIKAAGARAAAVCAGLYQDCTDLTIQQLESRARKFVKAWENA